MCGQRCNEERAGDAQTTSEGVRQCTGVGEDIVGEIIRKEDPVTTVDAPSVRIDPEYTSNTDPSVTPIRYIVGISVVPFCD